MVTEGFYPSHSGILGRGPSPARGIGLCGRESEMSNENFDSEWM